MNTIAEAITLLYTVKAKPGKEEETGQVLTGLITASRHEAGNIIYETFQAVDDAAKFFVYSVWTTQEALENHHATSVVRSAIAKFGDLAEGDFRSGMNILRKLRPPS